MQHGTPYKVMAVQSPAEGGKTNRHTLEHVRTLPTDSHWDGCCLYLCVFTLTLKMFLETKIHSAFYNWTSIPSARGWSLRQSNIFLNAGSLFCFWNCTSKDQMAQSEYIQEGRGSHQRCPETKETTSKSHHAIWTCYRTDGTLNCLILSAEQRKETFLK